MNCRAQGNIITDEKLGKALNALYNVWFNKWRRMTREMTDRKWDECLAELVHIVEQGNYEVVFQIGWALAMELDARARGHYPEWEKEFTREADQIHGRCGTE